MAVGSGGEVMTGCGWSCLKLWLAVRGGDEIIAGRGWLWKVAAILWLVMGDYEWSWMGVVVARFSNAR